MSLAATPTTSVPNRKGNETKSDLSLLEAIRKRSQGSKYVFNYDDKLAFKLYSNFYSYDVNEMPYISNYGGIFNLEFSLDGRLLIAACEGRQVLVFDAANQKKISTIDNAHLNCVNCVRFLNDKYFASCSDDTTINIWDIRKPKDVVLSLHGHSNWVKNIEWCEGENTLVTSAFDGSIYAWNLKNFTETSLPNDKVFLMNGLMRMKLTGDGSKMIISTTNGYMIIIHDLDIATLATDLRSFRPNLYRLMQISDQCFPLGTIYNYLFSPTRKRNRIEFVDDFPNKAEVISSLQIHPHGWSAVSRNLSSDDVEEWTSVHDIQHRNPSDYENAFTYVEDDESESEELVHPDYRPNQRPTDLWMGFMSLDEHIDHSGDGRVSQNLWENYQLPSMSLINSGLIGSNSNYNTYFRQRPDERNKIIRNLPRLTHFVKEKNVGKGYIKELCFSSDGRIVCSPYDKGVRLLAFNDEVHELSKCVPEQPQQMKTLIELNDYHKGVVVSCKFSPVHYQLVSGCLNSEIKWYQPVL